MDTKSLMGFGLNEPSEGNDAEEYGTKLVLKSKCLTRVRLKQPSHTYFVGLCDVMQSVCEKVALSETVGDFCAATYRTYSLKATFSHTLCMTSQSPTK